MKLDIAKMVAKARSKGKPDEPANDIAKTQPADDYSCGERAIAAIKHGDAEAFEQAVMDIVNKQ